MGFLLGNEEAASKYNLKLNSITAKQLTISQFQNALDTHTSGYTSGGYLNNAPFFDTYYNNLNTNGISGSNGYPVTTSSFRKIALSNGSLTGNKMGIESEKFLDVRGFVNINPFAFNFGGLLGAAFLTDFFDNIYGNDLNIELDVIHVKDYYMPANGDTAIIFEGKGFNKNNLLPLNAMGSVYPKYRLSVNNNDLRGSLDIVPGGFLPKTVSSIKNAIITSLHDLNLATETLAFIKDQSFVPTFTSLAHYQPNQNWSNPINTNLLCQNNILTPFDSYFGIESNTEHVSFTKESVAWLKKELDGNPQAPHFPIQDNALTGESKVCVTDTATYTIADICKVPSPVKYVANNGSVINGWSVSNNLQIITSTPYSVTVKSIGAGSRTITATFQNGQKIDKEILFINKPSPATMLTYSNIPYDSSQLNGPYWNPTWFFKSANPDEHITEFIFKDLNDTVLVTKNPNNLGMVDVSASELGISYGTTLTFYVYTKNVCGEINLLKKNVLKNTVYYPTLCQYGIGAGCHMERNATNLNIFKVYPNPANNIVNIDLRDASFKAQQNITISGELFDLSGLSKTKIVMQNNIASFSVHGLSKGIYALKIYIGNTIETHSIAVE